MNKKEMHDMAVELLTQAQNGDKFAEGELITLVKEHYMIYRIGKYLGKNRKVDNDDIKQEFLIGVSLGIKDAKMDVGDPIEYIIHSGVYRVRTYFRSGIILNTIQICHDCGNKSRMNRVADGVYQCKKCGSIHVTTAELDDHNEIALQNMEENGFEEDVLSDMMVHDFKKTLTPGTNIYNLYELLIEKDLRNDPTVKNYISAIAKEWGGTSNQNVVQNLKKLKKKLIKWMDDNELSYPVEYSMA